MQMLNESRRPICEWEHSSMEEYSGSLYCCGEETGLHRQNNLVQFFHQREKRLVRMAQLLALGLLLVSSLALTLLVALLLGRRDPQTPGSQPTTHPENLSTDTSSQQKCKMEDMYPSIMVTAPAGNNTVGKYLVWQSILGHTHCQGGFSYSNGNLVVPRKGKYKVYLQITYAGDHCDEELRLRNNVFLFQTSYPEDILLLSSVDTVCCNRIPWHKSIHTDGSFILDANSRLYVTSSHPELIDKNESFTFFGTELQTVHVSIN